MKTDFKLIALLSAIMLISVSSQGLLGDPNTFVLSGSGSTNVVADTAIIYAYVTETGSTGNNATAAAQATVDSIIAALSANGLSSSAIQTTGYYVYPIYDYSGPTPIITGYTVYNYLTITINNIATNPNLVVNVINAVINAGANSISGITYTQSNPQLGVSQARTIAFNDARTKATQYSLLSGRKLGRIITIEQVNVAVFQPTSINLKASSVGAITKANAAKGLLPDGSVPPAGILITVNVIVIWALN